MTKKIDSKTSGIITGPALRSVSKMVCERSGTRGGVAVASCAITGDALASAANRRTLIFMPEFCNDMQGDYRMQMLALEDQTHAGSPSCENTKAQRRTRKICAG